MTTPISRPATAALIAALLTTYIGGACSGGAQGQVVTPMSIDAGPGSAEPRLSSGADGTTWWSFLAKKWRKAARISLVLVWPKPVWPTRASGPAARLSSVPLALVCFTREVLAEVMAE